MENVVAKKRSHYGAHKDSVRHLNIWITNDEYSALKEVVDATGMTQQNLMRKLITQAAETIKAQGV